MKRIESSHAASAGAVPGPAAYDRGGDQATVTGMAMVMRPITEPGIYSSGIPLQTNKEWRKTAARVMRIEEMHKRLSKLEKKLDQE